MGSLLLVTALVGVTTTGCGTTTGFAKDTAPLEAASPDQLEGRPDWVVNQPKQTGVGVGWDRAEALAYALTDLLNNFSLNTYSRDEQDGAKQSTATTTGNVCGFALKAVWNDAVVPSGDEGSSDHEEKITWTVQATLLLPAKNDAGQPISYQTLIDNGQHRAVVPGDAEPDHKDYSRRNVQTISENISIHGILKHIAKAGCTPRVAEAEESVFLHLIPSAEMTRDLEAQKAAADAPTP